MNARTSLSKLRLRMGRTFTPYFGSTLSASSNMIGSIFSRSAILSSHL